MKTTPTTGFSSGAPMSMVNPSTDALMKKIDSRYSLVVLAAKRARQILVGSPIRTEQGLSVKDVTNALEEILEGKISYTQGKNDLPGEEEWSDTAATIPEFSDEQGSLPTEDHTQNSFNEVPKFEAAQNGDAISAAALADTAASETANDDVSDFVIDAPHPALNGGNQ